MQPGLIRGFRMSGLDDYARPLTAVDCIGLSLGAANVQLQGCTPQAVFFGLQTLIQNCAGVMPKCFAQAYS